MPSDLSKQYRIINNCARPICHPLAIQPQEADMDYASSTLTGPELRAKADYYRHLAITLTDPWLLNTLQDLSCDYDDEAEKLEKRDATEVAALSSGRGKLNSRVTSRQTGN